MVKNDIDLNNYLTKLVNKVFKILPLREENPEYEKKYLNSLLIELRGAVSTFNSDGDFMSIIFSLEGIRDVQDYNVVRSEIFKCIDKINKLEVKYKKEV